MLIYILSELKLGFMSRSTAKVILGQLLNITACGSRTGTEVTACDLMPNLLTAKATADLYICLSFFYTPDKIQIPNTTG